MSNTRESMPKVFSLLAAILLLSHLCVSAQAQSIGQFYDELEEFCKTQVDDGVSTRPHERYFRFAHNCLEIAKHNRLKGGASPGTSITDRIPQPGGFVVNLTYFEDGLPPSQGSPQWGRKVGRWLTLEYFNLYRMGDGKAELMFVMEFNSQTNPKYLRAFQEFLSQHGEPVFPERMNATEFWTKYRREFRDTLNTEFRKSYKKALWNIDHGALVGAYRLREYDIHDVDESGHISAVPYTKVGPEHDGFRIDIKIDDVLEFRPDELQQNLTKTAYWSEFHDAIRHEGLIIDVQYGVRVKLNPLLETIDIAVETVLKNHSDEAHRLLLPGIPKSVRSGPVGAP